MKNTFLLKTFLLILTTSIISCSSDDDSIDNESNPSLTISSDKSNITNSLEESFTFTVVNQDEEDVTIETTIFINGNSIEGNTFNSSEIGTYEVYATKDELQSNSITINISEEPVDYYAHKVLLEDYTGTWCGYCPRVTYSIELLHEETDRVVIAALHRAQDQSSSQYAYDPFTFHEARTLEQKWNDFEGYPYAKINRTETWEFPEFNNLNQATDKLQNSSPFGIAISSNLEETSGSIDVSFKFSEDVSENLKYIVYIAEDKVLYDQTNYYTDIYGGKNPIEDFEQNDLVRALANDNILGTAIPSDNTITNGTYEVSLSANYVSNNTDNLKVIAFITDNEGNVLNVQVAKGNTEQDFEIVE